MALRKVLDLKLAETEYQLAKNGGPYVLTQEEGVDPYGVKYHREVDLRAISDKEVADLIDLLGSATEELLKLKAAVGRGGGE